MNNTLIEIFLAIAKEHSISKAADYLYISQPTVSNRLKQLENQIGEPLFIRSQGKKNLSLSQKGEEFMILANRYESLMIDIDKWINNISTINLKVSGPASLHSYILSPFFNQIADKSESITLSIYTHWNHTIYKLLESYDLDIGFTTRSFPSAVVITKPIYSEKMVLVSHKEFSDYPENLGNYQLSPKNEIYLDWGPEFNLWHDSLWSPGIKKKCIVDTPMLIENFIRQKDAWAIVPITIANNMSLSDSIIIHSLNEPIPNRSIFLAVHSAPKASTRVAVVEFERLLNAFLDNLKKQ